MSGLLVCFHLYFAFTLAGPLGFSYAIFVMSASSIKSTTCQKPSTYIRPKEGFAEITAHIPKLLKFRFRARALEMGLLLSPALEEAISYWLNECTLPAVGAKEVPTPGLMGTLYDLLPTGLYNKIDEHRRAAGDTWATVLLESMEAYAAAIPAPPLRVPRPDSDSGVHQRVSPTGT